MNKDSSSNNTDSQALLNQIVLDFMRDQKHKRIWRWTFRLIILVLLVLLCIKVIALTEEDEAEGKKPHVGLIDLSGNIFDTENANADNFAKGMDAAYKKTGLKALIIRINSPGGSAVQADYMFNTIQYYRRSRPDIKVYAVCVDMCASAAYYAASAADEIYANESSIVGSIGVLYNGFGFVDAMQKLGVTRRLQTAGTNKAMMDPFSPVAPQAQQFLQNLLDDIHQEFIDKVKLGRGSRLKTDADTFSGMFWTGRQAKERGLIDGISSGGQIAREIVKLDTVIDYTFKQNLFERVSKNIGLAIAGGLPNALGLNAGIRAQLF